MKVENIGKKIRKELGKWDNILLWRFYKNDVPPNKYELVHGLLMGHNMVSKSQRMNLNIEEAKALTKGAVNHVKVKN